MRLLLSVTTGLTLAVACFAGFQSATHLLADASRPLSICLAVIAGIGFWMANRPGTEVERNPSMGTFVAATSLSTTHR